jgi:hypothetical protein
VYRHDGFILIDESVESIVAAGHPRECGKNPVANGLGVGISQRGYIPERIQFDEGRFQFILRPPALGDVLPLRDGANGSLAVLSIQRDRIP